MDMGVPLTDEQLPIIQFELVDIFKTRPRAEWVQQFLDADVCAGRAPAADRGVRHAPGASQRMVVTVDDPVLGPVEQVAPAIKFSATPGEVRGPAPRIGEHTDDVLSTSAGWPTAGPPARHRCPTPARCSTGSGSSTSARTTRGRIPLACSPTSALTW